MLLQMELHSYTASISPHTFLSTTNNSRLILSAPLGVLFASELEGLFPDITDMSNALQSEIRHAQQQCRQPSQTGISQIQGTSVTT